MDFDSERIREVNESSIKNHGVEKEHTFHTLTLGSSKSNKSVEAPKPIFGPTLSAYIVITTHPNNLLLDSS